MGEITDSESKNTTTPYKLAIVGRVWFWETGNKDPSWHVCRVATWASNCLVTSPTAILLGDPATGILAASYGGYMTAVLDTWHPTCAEEWALFPPFPFRTCSMTLTGTAGPWTMYPTLVATLSFTKVIPS